MKVFTIDFSKPERTPKNIEQRLNDILSKGGFKSATQTESPTTGRLFYSVFIKEDAPQDTFAKVFRDIYPHELTTKVNSFLSKAEIRAINQTVGKSSNAIMMTLFCKSDTKNQKTDA